MARSKSLEIFGEVMFAYVVLSAKLRLLMFHHLNHSNTMLRSHTISCSNVEALERYETRALEHRYGKTLAELFNESLRCSVLSYLNDCSLDCNSCGIVRRVNGVVTEFRASGSESQLPVRAVYVHLNFNRVSRSRQKDFYDNTSRFVHVMLTQRKPTRGEMLDGLSCTSLFEHEFHHLYYHTDLKMHKH